MYDKDERADSFASWMIASGARLDPPSPLHLGHLIAVRDGQRGIARSISPLARLAAWFGLPAVLATSPMATTNATTCCTPA
jgi:hypothetical protein